MAHAAALSKNFGAATGAPAPPTSSAIPDWNPAIVHLAARLAIWPQPDIRQRAVEIYRLHPPLGEYELIAALRDLIHSALGEAVTVLAQAIGVEPDALLRFAHPTCPETEIAGEYARLRCLHRIWSGQALQVLEAVDTLQVDWPGNLEPLVVQRGPVWLDGSRIEAYTRTWLPAGSRFLMHAGASVLLRDLLLVGLVEAAEAAGISVGPAPEAAAASESPLQVTVAIGAITLVGRRAHVNDRKVNLTTSEATLLRTLADSPGAVVSRGRLADALGIKSPTGVERIVVNLRNKLGDGVIGTVYGAGYLLE